MQLSDTVGRLQEDLTTLGGLGDPAIAQAVSQLVQAMEGPVRVRLLDLLGEVADELDGQLPSGRVELRLSGREATLVFVDEGGQPEPDPGDEQSARITLRLGEALKTQVETAAAREGLSTNTWIVRVLSRASSPGRPAHSATRLSGYGRA